MNRRYVHCNIFILGLGSNGESLYPSLIINKIKQYFNRSNKFKKLRTYITVSCRSVIRHYIRVVSIIYGPTEKKVKGKSLPTVDLKTYQKLS